jgi:predicted CXXCH cytochrome family protein
MNRLFSLILTVFLFIGISLTGQVTTEKTCIECHEDLVKLKYVHLKKDQCEDCHKSNNSKHPEEGIIGFELTKKIPDLCYDCHESVVKDKVLHEPATDGNCLFCHDTHQSDNPKLLVSNENDLCLKCHDKPIVYKNLKIVNIKELLKENNYIHSAIDSGCTVCHSPHESDNTYRFKKHFPGGESYLHATKDSFALCFSCHDSKLFEDAFSKSATNFRIGDENLHYLHVNREKSRNCNRCHNVHGSKNPFHINETVRFGNWDMPINYKKTENGGSCFPGCHVRRSYDRFAKPARDTITNDRHEEYVFENKTNIVDEFNKRLSEFSKLKFKDIKFEFGSSNIIKGTDKNLINIVNFMKKYPDCKVEIQGYTDNLGENSININLSEERAKKVKQLMVNMGIAYYRIYTIGYGKSNPIAPNDTEKNRAKNRRVEIKLVR